MTAPRAHVHFSEPATPDLEWIDQQVRRAERLAARYAGVGVWSEGDMRTLDRALESWSRDREADRPNPTEVAQAGGVVVGRLVARRIGLKWMVCEQGGTRVLTLWGRSAGGADVTLDPVAVVAKRIEEGMTGFLAELGAGLCDDLLDALGA
jgi:hypothetical protein